MFITNKSLFKLLAIDIVIVVFPFPGGPYNKYPRLYIRLLSMYHLLEDANFMASSIKSFFLSKNTISISFIVASVIFCHSPEALETNILGLVFSPLASISQISFIIWVIAFLAKSPLTTK